jgi:hypothetical protein
MKRWLPWFFAAGVILFLLWRAFGKAGAARRQRQGELDSVLGWD